MEATSGVEAGKEAGCACMEEAASVEDGLGSEEGHGEGDIVEPRGKGGQCMWRRGGCAAVRGKEGRRSDGAGAGRRRKWQRTWRRGERRWRREEEWECGRRGGVVCGERK